MYELNVRVTLHKNAKQGEKDYGVLLIESSDVITGF